MLFRSVDTLQRGSEAPAAWVSGFFGSGKSHLVKMLRALWTNTPFQDGRTPRDIARLPSSVADALKELDTLARQKKAHLLAASGTLSQGEGDSIRKAVLGIVFKACGLPSSYSAGKALMWLRNEGVEDAVRQALDKNKRSLERELINPSMSTSCWRRPNFEPLCRPNIEPGWEPTLRWSAVDKFRSLAGSATSV